MPRRRRDDAVAQRVGQRLADRAERRRDAAQRAAQTRRQRREQQRGEGQPQPAAERPTQAPTTRHSRPRAHGDMLTVAIRGHFAERMRGLAETHGMSLSKLLKDSILVYSAQVDAGYEPGTSLANWTAQHGEPAADA